MKIGIIVYSQTGNTLSVAEKLKNRLTTAGNTVNIEKVTAAQDGKGGGFAPVEMKTAPNAALYDMVVFGAPVMGASLHPVMKEYLSQLDSVKGKKAACFVTEGFPYPWMGGNRSVGQMKKICESKGINVIETGIVNWSKNRREKTTNEVLEKMDKVGK
jgi:flavodoxin